MTATRSTTPDLAGALMRRQTRRWPNPDKVARMLIHNDVVDAGWR